MDPVNIVYILLSDLFLILYFRGNNKQLLFSNAFLFGVVSIPMLINLFSNYFIEIYSGYFSETIKLYRRALGTEFVIWIFLPVLIWIFPLFNLNRKIRKSVKFQLFILILFLVVALSHLYAFGFNLREVTTRVEPGWHTTTYPPSYWLGTFFIVLALGVLLNYTIIKRGWVIDSN